MHRLSISIGPVLPRKLYLLGANCFRWSSAADSAPGKGSTGDTYGVQYRKLVPDDLLMFLAFLLGHASSSTV